ncbi:MAG TPA: DNA polymerase III subunit delta' [Burkholderiales bacterium]
MKVNIYPWQISAWERLVGQGERLHHALLIHGPAGIGKLALAERFAQFLLCESEGATKPCGACDGCRWFVAGSHPDLRRLEPEALARRLAAEDESETRAAPAAKAAKPSQEIRVDQVRELDGFLSLRSHRGRRRIVLVHPAEAMNVHAANALLKALEEPQPGAHFLLVSHRPARLLPTIRSRCAAVPLALPEPELARTWLKEQSVPEAEAWLTFAGGAPLQALIFASEESGAMAGMRAALKARDFDAMQAASGREELEALAEVLQRRAIDVAMRSLSGRDRFGTGQASRGAAAWLRYARELGRFRALARHPLNPRLLAGEMLAGMPRD